MKELDFDFFMSQDAGRTFYRGLFIYASLYSLKHYSLSPGIQRALNFVQTELWKPSNCFIAMRPRLRLLYVAAVASFVPYLTKKGAQKALGSDEVNLFYGGNVGLGVVNGGLITGLCLTFNPWYIETQFIIENNSNYCILLEEAQLEQFTEQFGKLSKNFLQNVKINVDFRIQVSTRKEIQRSELAIKI